MFDLLLVVGITYLAASYFTRGSKRASRSRQGEEARTERGDDRSDLAVRDAPGLQTQVVPRDRRFGFVSAFGLRPAELKELHVYASAGKLEEFPQKVGELLRKLYDNGLAVGEDMMALVNHGRPLKNGEAIYVAVVRDQRSQRNRTVAFLDRHRTG